MRLRGKVALITGGFSGVGAATAARFLQEGATVIAAGLDNGLVRQSDPGITTIFLDVTREEDWQAGMARLEREFGRLDILVNSAGRSGRTSDDPLENDAWDRVMDTNARGIFLGMKHAAPLMRESGGGSVVNIGSIMALVGGSVGHPAYHASKGAVCALTRTFAVRLGPDRIRVNAVHPGVLPPMRGVGPIDPEVLNDVVAQTPLRRTGLPDEIAAAVAFLASDDAAFVTGVDLVVDGGFTIQ